jgi:hypothetical protein
MRGLFHPTYGLDVVSRRGACRRRGAVKKVLKGDPMSEINMIPNRISIVLSAEDRAEIIMAINILKEKLPFLIGIEPEERRGMLKVGDRDRAFIDKSYDVGQRIPDYLPKALSMDEMSKDMELMAALYPIMVAISQLAEKLADTYAIAASEAYAAALVIYRNAKDARGSEGLEEAIADLGRRFVRRTTTVKEPTETKKKK